jgi:hypothetical protein
MLSQNPYPDEAPWQASKGGTLSLTLNLSVTLLMAATAPPET